MTHKYQLVTMLGLMAVVETVSAQTFNYINNDLALGFRKTSGTLVFEVIVNVGQASNYLYMAPGTTISVPNFTPSQLSPDSFTGLTNLNWSVIGAYLGTNYAGYPQGTLWLTSPRSSTNVQSSVPTREGYTQQTPVRQKVQSILNGAKFLSGQIGVSNADNNAHFVREPIDGTHNLSVSMASGVDFTQGNLNDTWVQNNVENTTPPVFSSSIRSDLYEIWPFTDAGGNVITDPHTGTNGMAYYVGYFQFSPNGTMTFTRATATPPPPPAPVLSIGRSGNTSTIYFGTASGATYTLYYTNAVGLTAPVTTWGVSATTVTGNGNTNSIPDTTTDPIRYYRVGAH